MTSERNIIHNTAITHCEGEGDWCLCAQPAGEDDDD